MSDSAKPIDLPEHVADAGEWKAWPRKVEAHVQWGVRQRQVEQHCRTGRLKMWGCPDGSVRLEPDALTELYGPKGVVSARDRDLPRAERQRKIEESSIDTTDPVALMFRAAVSQLNGTHHLMLDLVRHIDGPMAALVKAYQDQAAELRQRIRDLERHQDEAMMLRSELENAVHDRDLSAKRHTNAERRRDETLGLLKEQLPKLASLYVDGDSLTAWAKRAPRDVIEAIVESDSISAVDAEKLRKAAGLQPKPPQPPNQSNGAM